MSRRAILLPLAALAFATPAVAQDGWRLQVTPYVWGSGISGEVTPLAGGPTLEFDSGLPEVLEDLDGAFFLSGTARNGRLVILGDVSASASSREGVVPPGLPASGEVSQRSATLAAGAQFQTDPRATLDVLVGLRRWDLEASAAAPLVGLSAGTEASFTDPIVAARANVALADRTSAILYADVGGWGVGSEATGQVVATLNYAVTERLFVSGGWRWLHVDYEGEGTGIEATLSGPLLGATWRF